eukprot:557744-Pyramimonas_sp.AAC.1
MSAMGSSGSRTGGLSAMLRSLVAASVTAARAESVGSLASDDFWDRMLEVRINQRRGRGIGRTLVVERVAGHRAPPLVERARRIIWKIQL